MKDPKCHFTQTRYNGRKRVIWILTVNQWAAICGSYYRSDCNYSHHDTAYAEGAGFPLAIDGFVINDSDWNRGLVMCWIGAVLRFHLCRGFELLACAIA